MGTVAVIEAGELRQHFEQVGLVHHDEVIEALSTAGPDEELGDGVRPRRPHGREQGFDADGRRVLGEVTPEGGVPIPEEEARPRAAQLPPR